jgi:hypothetical protein
MINHRTVAKTCITEKPLAQAMREFGHKAYEVKEIYTNEDVSLVNDMETMCIGIMVLPGWTSLNVHKSESRRFVREALTYQDTKRIECFIADNPSLTFQQVGDNFNINYNTVRHINSGTYTTATIRDTRPTDAPMRDNSCYPIRSRYQRSVTKRWAKNKAN